MNLCSFKHLSAFLLFFTLTSICFADVPENYYASAKGMTGKDLKSTLYLIIAPHTEREYSDLWEDFKSTDVREDGTIWDMYSNITAYEPGGSKQGANFTQEGDAYNREHSFPKSWFGSETPMYTDLFHLYPTDGYVNGRRSNYPFGETEGETYQSANGFSKLGACTTSGYTGTVFEPADEYKGDFARTYFYMATAYEDQIASWDSPCLSGDFYTAFADWTLIMLLRWSQEDPVSEKEIARNEAVYGIQGNRNPFIDFPGLEKYLWDSMSTTAFDPDNYVEPDDVDYSTYVTDEDSDDDGDDDDSDANSDTSSDEGNVYALVTSTSDLSAGNEVLIVCTSKGVAMAEQSSDIRTYAEVTVSESNTVTTSVNASGLPYAFVLGGEEGAWSFYDETAETYLALTSSANKLHSATSADSDNALWTITIGDDAATTIFNNYYDTRCIQYNASSPRFACYTSTQMAVQLYSLLSTEGINQVLIAEESETVNVYDTNGRLLRKAVSGAAAVQGLAPGIYVVGGKKVIVR